MERAFGPVLAGEDCVFRLWAPGIDQAPCLLLDDREPLTMARVGEGWWNATAPAREGTLYRFRLPSGVSVPDPASRYQPYDVHGPSQLIGLDSYNWRCVDWRGRPWREAVIYELHVGLLGGYDGVRARLPELAELGITAIELMPLAAFRGARNWGYDGVLPFAPTAAYGTPSQLKALIDEAHARGLMVFLDVVYNHFGPDGNYLGAYAPQFFDAQTQTPWGGAIDFTRPEVRQFFTENAMYWLGDFRFDGLRFDAVHHIAAGDWLREVAAAIRAHFPDRHIHLVVENEHNEAALLRQGFNAQWNDDFHNTLHVILTGETTSYYADFADEPEEKLLRALTEGFVYQGEPSFHQQGRLRGTPSTGLSPLAFVNFLQNHDQVGNRASGERLARLISAPLLSAAVSLLVLAPSIPLIFMGEEYGATTPFLFFTDFDGALADAVREGRRREFAKDPAFADEARRSFIPDPNDVATFERSRPTPNEASEEWRRLYRALLTVRREHILPSLDETAHSAGGKVIGASAVLAAWRLRGGAVLSIACNLGSEPIALDSPPGRSIWGEASGVLEPATTLAWLAA